MSGGPRSKQKNIRLMAGQPPTTTSCRTANDHRDYAAASSILPEAHAIQTVNSLLALLIADKMDSYPTARP